MFGVPSPAIPTMLMRDMIDIQPGQGYHDPAQGGQWVAQSPTEVMFQGAVLPADEHDKQVQHLAAGTYAAIGQKLYTNGYTLKPGQTVRDAKSGITYTVKQQLQYSPIHPLRRYLIETRGEASAK